MTGTFTNPILCGAYPDPSICRVGGDYYMVNSSFEYFPAIPIHHSKDLVNWELVGYGVHREEQCAVDGVNLFDVQMQGGIYAPSIRYHDGTFYIITTCAYVTPDKHQTWRPVNFIVTADDVRGEWSVPQIIEDAPGIDPDIIFDDDGRVWYVGAKMADDPNFESEGEIWLQELDPENWQLIGERYFLWRGACGGTWAEAPHIYKRNGMYYLMIAEGGTGFHHAVTIAISADIRGPYVSNPRNPILTSRHLSSDYWVTNVGHGDLFETHDGRWFMVALGVRNESNHGTTRGTNMGRETHLVPVIWEHVTFEREARYEWPVCAPLTGRVERHNPMPFDGTHPIKNAQFHDDFVIPDLNPSWNFRRIPTAKTYSLTDNAGYLRLFAQRQAIADRARYSWIGIRQQESAFTVTTTMYFKPESDDLEAGLCLLQQDDNYLSYTLIRQDGAMALQLKYAESGKSPVILKSERISGYAGTLTLRIASYNGQYHYAYSLDQGVTYTDFTESAANLIVSHGFTGAFIGIYATANGLDNAGYADFDNFSCTFSPRE